MAEKKSMAPHGSTPSHPAPPSLQERLRLSSERLKSFLIDACGVFLLSLALMTLMAVFLPKWSGKLLNWWVSQLRLWFGWGVLWAALGFGIIGWALLIRRKLQESVGRFWIRVILLEGIAFSSLALLALIGKGDVHRSEAGMDGGRIGWGLLELTRRGLAAVHLDTQFILALLWLLALSAFFLLLLSSWVPVKKLALLLRGSEERSPLPPLPPVVSEAPLEGGAQKGGAGVAKRRPPSLPAQFRKNLPLIEDDEGGRSALPARDDRLPPLDLLVDEKFNRPDERTINMTAGLIEKTLAEFGIPAKVVGFRVGPTVTQFAIEPGYVEKEKNNGLGEAERHKVRIAQISALARDLALALAAERLRIEAPVPGRPYVGIEVPNPKASMVRLRPILESEIFYKLGSPLTIALGRDVSGAPVVADLAAMPHLLIAGTTGSGKSVCIAALTTCLVMNNTPEDMRLVMIDPKMVELVRFNGLPHLYGKVETEIERILAVLRWTVLEMERRYKLLEASHSRNIDTYNRKMRRRRDSEILPRIVVMIDELADLMMSAPDQTEHYLVRLAQMARATGIHLVIATQRPSTDVVTGLIKANFPARISFAVASSVDSRVILDAGGAESLLGRGDMLFMPPEIAAPIRVQGVIVSDQEVERVISFWQQRPDGGESTLPPWEELIRMEKEASKQDELIEQAIAVLRTTRRASTSLLQRRLRIGYPRAARLMDQLEEMGVVGPPLSGGKEREVLLNEDGEQ